MASGVASGAATGATVGSAFSPGVGSLLGAAAGGLLGLAADTWSSDRSREMDQADYQENQLQNFMYGQEAQRNAAQNEVSGLLKAGLNPALASGANPAQMVSAPMQNKEAPKLNLGMAQLLSGLRLQEAEIENVEAQTEKTNSEKNRIDLDYERELDYDATLSENMPRMLMDLSKDPRYGVEMQKVFVQAAKDAEEYGVSAGAVRGIKDYLALRLDQKKKLVEEEQSKFDWNLVIKQIEDPNMVKALVRMPEAQRENLLSASANYMQNIALMVSQGETEKSKQELYATEALKATREAQKIFHSDNAQMHAEKDVQGLMWNIGASFMKAVGSARK